MPQKKTFGAMIGEYSSLAFVLPVSSGIGYVMGYLLDKALHTHFLYIVFLILGTASGMLQIIRQLTRDLHEDDH